MYLVTPIKTYVIVQCVTLSSDFNFKVSENCLLFTLRYIITFIQQFY